MLALRLTSKARYAVRLLGRALFLIWCILGVAVVVAVLALLVTLSGCGSGGGELPKDNHGYGFAYDVQGAAGLKLRYTPILAKDDPLSDPMFLENIYAQVETCMNVNAPPPFVIFVPANSLGDNPAGLHIYGEYLTHPGLVLLYFPTSLDTPRHEFIHYLLDVSTGNPDSGHTSLFFQSRAEGGCS